jgi:hypothetical protein
MPDRDLRSLAELLTMVLIEHAETTVEDLLDEVEMELHRRDERDAPEDTPSLDTSLHDHEMDTD